MRTLGIAKERFRVDRHKVIDLGVRPEEAGLFWPLRIMAKEDANFVPLDSIPYANLSSMLGECLATGCLLATAPSRTTSGDGGDSTTGTG